MHEDSEILEDKNEIFKDNKSNSTKLMDEAYQGLPNIIKTAKTSRKN